MSRDFIAGEVDTTCVVTDVGSYDDTVWWFGLHDVASCEGGEDSLGG